MKRIICLAIYVFTCFHVTGQDFHRYEAEKIASLPKDHFTFDFRSPGINGPLALGFNSQGIMYINDPLNDGICVFSADFKLIERITKKDIGYGFRYIVHDGFIEAEEYDGIKIVFLKEKESFYFSFKELGSDIQRGIWVQNKLFLYDSKKSLSLVLNAEESIVGRRLNVISSNQMKTLLNTPEMYGLQDVTIDNQNRIFLNGVLQTRDYQTFSEYWSEKTESYSMNQKHKFKPMKSTSNGMVYLGIDGKGNSYWEISPKWLMIFNPEGWVIDAIQFDYKKTKTLPTVHPSGDIYFLDYDDNGVYLYRIKNVWDPKGREAWYKAHP